MRYLTDFTILAQYKVYVYPCVYGRLSCRPPPVLLFRAAKAAKSVAREAPKNPQCRNVNQEFQLETEEVIHKRRSLQLS